ncbi:Bug family tripartite tricarboxylate transporter substrate binding protein [Variovorax sp. M-6]|uniref:Bug family tripartite tricarboxylate transporter substrate binding protein n=1 Tax=Variovorax sp. M-6 TaxID=3233041 RepID=UPI003F954111
MKTYGIRTLRTCFAALVLALSTSAYAWPDKPLKIVVPAPAGGLIDVIARVYGDFLAQELGQSVVIDNRAGAGGMIGVQAMLSAPADGYTLLVTNSNVLAETPHVMKPPYDPLKDVKAVAVLARARSILLAAPDLPAKDMAGLVAYLKTATDKGSFGSPGAGTLPHVGGEVLNRRLGADMQHVPFSGTPTALVALMSGQISLYFSAVVASTPLVSTGKVIALGVSGTSRVSAMPQVPTFSEQGFPEFAEFSNYLGLALSPKAPPEVAAKLYAATLRIAQSPQFNAKIAGIGFEPLVPTSSEQFGEIVAAEFNRNGELIRRLNLKP